MGGGGVTVIIVCVCVCGILEAGNFTIQTSYQAAKFDL